MSAGEHDVLVRPATGVDAAAWAEMRRELWPAATGEPDEHAEEVARHLAGERPRGPWAAFVAHGPDGAPIGFAEVSVRPYAEGCRTANVAYLEGWFVRREARRRGVGAALVAACERWGRARGCRELASDAGPENAASHAAHRAAGFDDAGLVRCFRKDL